VPGRAGGSALGARLRRLSDRIDREASSVYAAQGIAFEQRWFGMIHQLHREGSGGVADLAKSLGVTHAAISQTRKALEANGLIVSTGDPGDARRSVLTLSAKGRRLATKLAPTWAAMNRAAAELNTEAGEVVEALERLERALARRSLKDRVQALLPGAKE
jgi:DNA-binding MarR family transcriptional regulator